MVCVVVWTIPNHFIVVRLDRSANANCYNYLFTYIILKIIHMKPHVEMLHDVVVVILRI